MTRYECMYLQWGMVDTLKYCHKKNKFCIIAFELIKDTNRQSEGLFLQHVARML